MIEEPNGRVDVTSDPLDIQSTIWDYYLSDLIGVKKGEPVYIKKVGSHLEIGKAKVECLP
ncbi:MAG: hypothetical protein KKG04_02345 [Candidatus Thermoplasmatota archaeon]|nr:hypothetical protein [Candidatus Thermoplasmatota archaeon]